MNKLFPMRRLLPAAATSAALVSLTGCGLLNFGHVPETSELAIPPAPPATQPTLAQQTAKDVQRQVDRMNAALDQQGKAAAPMATAAVDGGKATAATPAAPAGSAASPAAASVGTASAVTPAGLPNAALASANPPAPAASATGTPTIISAMASMTAANGGQTAPGPAGAAALNGAAADASMGSLLDVLRQRVAAHPNEINYALALELLETAETGKPADPASLGALSAVDQKLLADLVPAVQSLAARPATPSTTLADRAAPLTAAAERWAADADLTLPRLALASRVDSYGVYAPVEPKFEYGKRNVVIIYCEVAHFSSKAIDDTTTGGHETIYETRLAQQDTLITDDGLLVWRPNPEEVEDRSRNQRHDFYLVKKLTIPENLAIGKYTLRMSVTDKLSNKIAMATIPIEIVGAGGSVPISSTAGK